MLLMSIVDIYDIKLSIYELLFKNDYLKASVHY